MLLNFSCKNFKTFREEAFLSMEPTSSRELSYKKLSYSILNQQANGKEYNALPTAVVYGPNAAGKSNLLAAMATLRFILLQGNIKSPSVPGLNTAFSLLPNFHSEKNEPVVFEIEFIHQNLKIDYSLGFCLESFSDNITEYNRNVVLENLSINDKNFFERNGNKIVLNYSNKDISLLDSSTLKQILNQIQSNLSSTDLFLINGFKNMINLKLVEKIQQWFDELFITIYNSQDVLTTLERDKNASVNELPKSVSYALSLLGANNKIVYKKYGQNPIPIKTSIINRDGNSYFVPSELVESLGSIRFLDIFPFVISALVNGAVLVVDELDASIHPMAIMSLIKAFHNDEINVNGAQLIFNTHNPIFLNEELFRKDEIKFVEKDDDTGNSELYQLSDFKVNGRATRQTSDYMNNYFKNRYGAIRHIDFSDILESVTQKKAEK